MTMIETPVETAQSKKAFSMIELHQDKLTRILPAGYNAVQFAATLNAELQKNPELSLCTPESLLGAMIHFARLGIRPGVMNQGWLVPYNNSFKRCKEAQVIIGYEGLRDLALRSGHLVNIQSHLVHANDFFEARLGGESTLVHKPNFFSDRGEIIGVYAIGFYKTGATQFEVLGRAELEAMAAKSRSGNFWKNHFGEMSRKSAIRKLAKHLQKSTDHLHDHLSHALDLERRAENNESQETEAILLEAGIPYELPPTVAEENKIAAMKKRIETMLAQLPDADVMTIFKLGRQDVLNKITNESTAIQAAKLIQDRIGKPPAG